MTTKLMSRDDLELVVLALDRLATSAIEQSEITRRAARIRIELRLMLDSSAHAPSQAFRLVKV